jgi:ATP synthase, F0 subunit b
MELFTPDIGLIIWMFVPFLIVFVILAKFAWPAIIKGVDERSRFIEDSIQTAKEANERLAGIKLEGDKILAEAKEEQLRLLKEAAVMREQLIKEAKQQAGLEADKVMNDAKMAIQKEKESAIREIKSRVAALSVDIAEKVIRRDLADESAQMELINKLLDEASISKS